MYYKVLKFFQKQIEDYTKQIFKVYGNELTLKLEDYNLLEDENNSIESSTSIGFIIEEFLTSKLSIYTRLKIINNFVILTSFSSNFLIL
ncbi:hypothetical protein [Mesomycoplasma hyopneumoniae]|uniref:hypothetical protein n=1 Tax=Mesomycoplasma hyopneumoniae TaxID=2099 RepID=UPI00215D6569|nr:hypothetical protein [Mesomycoplasma hyopneumoniae]